MRRFVIATLVLCALSADTAAHAQRPVPLDTVRVEAGSRLVAGAASVTRSVDVFDRAKIDALPARTVADVIARALGADLRARSPAQADLSIRGGSFEQILVLVDGVAVNDRQTGHFHLDVAVPLDAVERIEVLRGPASAVYGSSAVGGVVNIVTRRDASGLGARVEAGSFGAHAFAADAATAHGGVHARVDADFDAADGHRDGTDHRTRRARASLTAPIGPGDLNAAAGYATRDFGASDFYAPFDSWEATRTATASLAWRSRPSAIVLEPRVSFRQHEDDFILRRDDPAFYRNVHTTRESGAELVARWRAADALSFAAGGEAHRSGIDSNSLGERSENRTAGFAEAAVGRVSAGLVTLGLRFDNHSGFGSFLSSSLAAGYRVSDALRLRASAGTGFRAPSWTDRYYEDPANIGTPDLAVERFRTAEVGSQVTAGPLTLDLAGFLRQADDLIDWGRPAAEPDSEPWRTLNIAEATFRGLEATAHLVVDRRVTSPADRSTVMSAVQRRQVTVTARASLLSFDAEPDDGYVSKYALQPLTRAASLEIAAPVTSRVTFAIRGSASRRADGATWEVLDARAAAGLGDLAVFADATNLLDASWLDVSGQPAPGRAFSLGARIRR